MTPEQFDALVTMIESRIDLERALKFGGTAEGAEVIEHCQGKYQVHLDQARAALTARPPAAEGGKTIARSDVKL